MKRKEKKNNGSTRKRERREDEEHRKKKTYKKRQQLAGKGLRLWTQRTRAAAQSRVPEHRAAAQPTPAARPQSRHCPGDRRDGRRARVATRARSAERGALTGVRVKEGGPCSRSHGSRRPRPVQTLALPPALEVAMTRRTTPPCGMFTVQCSSRCSQPMAGGYTTTRRGHARAASVRASQPRQHPFTLYLFVFVLLQKSYSKLHNLARCDDQISIAGGRRGRRRRRLDPGGRSWRLGAVLLPAW
mgnify:CR=1 FL=1